MGDLVEIYFGNKKYYTGIVQKIGAVANNATRTFNIEVLIDNGEQQHELCLLKKRHQKLETVAAHANIVFGIPKHLSGLIAV